MESAMNSLTISNGQRGPPQLETNVYLIHNDSRAVFRYSVTINKIIQRKNGQSSLEMSRAGGQDAIRIPRQRVCKAIVQIFSCNWSDTVILYEGSATLFATKEIPLISKEIPVSEVQSLIEDDDYKMHIRDASSLLIRITSDGGMVDITSMVRKSEEENHLIVDFLATLAREHAPTNRFVAFRGGKLIDQSKLSDIKFGHLRAPGISMGVRAVKNERDGGAPVMALDIDVTEATFFKPQSLVKTICEYFGVDAQKLKAAYGHRPTMKDVEKYMRDIPVRYEHTDKTFTLTGFKWDENHNDAIEKWSVAVCKDEQEAMKYAGCAVVTEQFKGGDGKTYSRHYPLDGLHVLPYTKVPKEKQKGLKPKPVLPNIRYGAMHQARRDIHIDTQNETMKNFGMDIYRKPIMVDQKRLDAPKMMGAAVRVQMGSTGGVLKETEIKTDLTKHNWDSSNFKFTKPATIDDLLFMFQTGPGQLQPNQAAELAKAHVECCKTKGMTIGAWNGKPVGSLDELEDTIKKFAAYRAEERTKEGKQGYRIFLILLGEKNLQWHDWLKLLEQRHAVQTQHIAAEVVRKMQEKKRSKDFTMLNIVMKTNVKAGGENVKIAELVGNSLFPSSEHNSPVTLIVGLDVAHPAPHTRHQIMRGIPVDPSCIGISSNCMTRNLQTFTGYEVYTESRKEAATDRIMNSAGRHLIEKFIDSQNRLPDNVVYFRDGVDKGQYDRVKDEGEALMEGMMDYLTSIGKEQGFNPRVLLVLATKRHNIRAYEVTKMGAQNVKAGTVIDMGIVSPFYPEFFLYASHALIGTAKGVQCTVLKDSSEADLRKYPDAKLKDMEKFVHALAFGHQICDSPTSLPEPLYNAHETAKRGSANFKAHKNTLEVHPLVCPEELTRQLSNRDTELGRVKYNA